MRRRPESYLGGDNGGEGDEWTPEYQGRALGGTSRAAAGVVGLSIRLPWISLVHIGHMERWLAYPYPLPRDSTQLENAESVTPKVRQPRL